MPITVTFLDDARVIEAVFPETFSLDGLYAGLDQTMALAEERGCRRFLVDTRAIRIMTSRDAALAWLSAE